jgi:hypothetical protein
MKILKIALVALISSFLMVVSSNAIEKRIGIAAGYTSVNASGTETLKDTGVKSISEAAANTVIPSIFVELATENGFGLGLEHVPGTADLNSKTRSRTHPGGTGNDSGTNTASAEIDGLTSIYVIKTFESGFFVKAGQTTTTVNTKEVLSSGSTYKNVDVDGMVLGLGINRTTDTGFFYRVSGEYTDYDSIKLTSEVADAVSGTSNTISADVDTVAFKLAIGKAF